MNNIYLDNAATTYPKPEIVYDTMDKYLRSGCVNAGRGSYSLAKEASNLIQETRELLLEMVDCNSGQVVFSASATLAINQVLRGLNWNDINNVYVSPFEHNAIMRTLYSLKKVYNFSISMIPFDNISFELNEDELKVMFAKDKPDLILLSHVSNVTGYILPIRKCHDLAKKYNPINVVDCAQSLGLVPINSKEEFRECDFIIFAGHKTLYGPFGIAGYIQLKDNIELREVITGGTGSDSTNLAMPKDDVKRYEPGSYNTYAISGLNAALKWIKTTEINNILRNERKLCNILISNLKNIDGIELYIPENLENHVGIVSFNINGYRAEEIGQILSDEFGICVRTGHHCAPCIGEFLEGMALDGTVRVSLGYFTKEDEINEFLSKIKII